MDVAALSTGGRRSALDLACLHRHVDTAVLLVVEGGADPYESAAGGESAMAMLRRRGTPEDHALLTALDGLCGAREAGTYARAERDEKPDTSDEWRSMCQCLDDGHSDDDEGGGEEGAESEELDDEEDEEE